MSNPSKAKATSDRKSGSPSVSSIKKVQSPKNSTDTQTGASGAAKDKKKISRLRTGICFLSISRHATDVFFLGCWTCRRRGYKCDEGKPFCYNCRRLNLSCEGYKIRLKWQEDEFFQIANKSKGKAASKVIYKGSRRVTN